MPEPEIESIDLEEAADLPADDPRRASNDEDAQDAETLAGDFDDDWNEGTV